MWGIKYSRYTCVIHSSSFPISKSYRHRVCGHSRIFSLKNSGIHPHPYMMLKNPKKTPTSVVENVHNPNRFHSLKIKEYRTLFSINCTSKVGFSDYSDKSGQEVVFLGYQKLDFRFFLSRFLLWKKEQIIWKRNLKKPKTQIFETPLPFPSLLFRLKTFVDSWEFCYICNIFFIHQDDEKCHELFE